MKKSEIEKLVREKCEEFYQTPDVRSNVKMSLTFNNVKRKSKVSIAVSVCSIVLFVVFGSLYTLLTFFNTKKETGLNSDVSIQITPFFLTMTFLFLALSVLCLILLVGKKPRKD